MGLELVAVVVDCMSTSLMRNGPANVRLLNVAGSRTNSGGQEFS